MGGAWTSERNMLGNTSSGHSDNELDVFQSPLQLNPNPLVVSTFHLIYMLATHPLLLLLLLLLEVKVRVISL